MTAEKQPSQEGKSGGRANKRRPFRGRKRERKPNAEGGEPREAPIAKERPQDRTLDKAQRERRERRRRRKLQAKQQDTAELQVNLLAQDEELNRPSPPVVVYTHVIRPDVGSGYEFRTEHFSKVTRRLEDFKIDLSPFFLAVAEEERRLQSSVVGDLVKGPADEDDWDDDWEDEEAGDDPASGVTLAQSPTIDELEDFDDTDPDAGDESIEDDNP